MEVKYPYFEGLHWMLPLLSFKTLELQVISSWYPPLLYLTVFLPAHVPDVSNHKASSSASKELAPRASKAGALHTSAALLILKGL